MGNLMFLMDMKFLMESATDPHNQNPMTLIVTWISTSSTHLVSIRHLIHLSKSQLSVMERTCGARSSS